VSIYRQGPAPANTCPRCRENLVVVPGHSGVRVCEKCGGVFADVDASRRIVSALDRALMEIGFQAGLGKPRKPDDRHALTCPECLVTMQKSRIEAAACEVDACPLHGTWFDTGELESVMRAFARARRQGAMPPGPCPSRTIPRSRRQRRPEA
jgi:Zn-finger nucleic acid-binding protein